MTKKCHLGGKIKVPEVHFCSFPFQTHNSYLVMKITSPFQALRRPKPTEQVSACSHLTKDAQTAAACWPTRSPSDAGPNRHPPHSHPPMWYDNAWEAWFIYLFIWGGEVSPGDNAHSKACLFFFNFLFYIRVQLINHAVIVSGAQQSDSAIHIHVSILPQTPLPSRLPHNIEQSSLCYTVGTCWLSILHMVVYICQS